MKNYSIEELSFENEPDLIEKLKESWDYPAEEDLFIYGKLRKISNNNIFFLERLKSIHNSSNLFYPLNNASLRQNVYIGYLNKFGVSETIEDSWVKAKVALSPLHERKKHNNPFMLMAVTIEPLTEILIEDIDVEKSSHDIYTIDEDLYIKKLIFDHYYQIAQKDIHKKIDEINTKKIFIESKIENLNEREFSLIEEVSLLEEKHKEYTALIKKSDIDYQNKILNLEIQMNKINDYLKSQTDILKRIDLISDDDIKKLSLSLDSNSERDGHSFEDTFDSNYSQAIAYIQSYLWHNNIIYARSVLEDFFALIRTNDLIILAGDSGSGKTNLVKSFAKAIGGKSVIIPVKPNWTSAEDLLGYYNPLENKYLSTKFLDALLEAQQNPDIPYFICLDEMNLARVEYYFADFLSLLEEREEQPEIQLFSASEGEVLESELKNFISLINETSIKIGSDNFESFIDILKDEEFNLKLHELCGFREGSSLLKYHSQLKKLLNNFVNTPSSITLPKNVRIIGAINVDETTHYLSPKILDRAHIMKFASPLLTNWDEIEEEITDFDLDISLPLNFDISDLGERKPYPVFDRENKLVKQLIHIVKQYLDPMGIEFGLRTIRQALEYSEALSIFESNEETILNNIVIHKILPKLLFDGEKTVDADIKKKDILLMLDASISNVLGDLNEDRIYNNAVKELKNLIKSAEANDWVVNYWAR